MMTTPSSFTAQFPYSGPRRSVQKLMRASLASSCLRGRMQVWQFQQGAQVRHLRRRRNALIQCGHLRRFSAMVVAGGEREREEDKEEEEENELVTSDAGAGHEERGLWKPLWRALATAIEHRHFDQTVWMVTLAEQADSAEGVKRRAAAAAAEGREAAATMPRGLEDGPPARDDHFCVGLGAHYLFERTAFGYGFRQPLTACVTVDWHWGIEWLMRAEQRASLSLRVSQEEETMRCHTWIEGAACAAAPSAVVWMEAFADRAGLAWRRRTEDSEEPSQCLCGMDASRLTHVAYLHAVEWLVRHGANVGREGMRLAAWGGDAQLPVLQYVHRRCHLSMDRAWLPMLCAHGHLNVLHWMREAQSDACQDDAQGTALQQACAQGRLAVVEFLLTRGVSAEVSVRHLNAADVNGHAHILEYLLADAAGSPVPVPAFVVAEFRAGQRLRKSRRMGRECSAEGEAGEMAAWFPL